MATATKKAAPLPVLEARKPKLKEIKESPNFGSLRVLASTQRRIVLEAEPERRLYWFCDKPFNIPFPWTYYIVSYIQGRQRWGSYVKGYWKLRQLFASPYQVGLDDTVCRMPVPNLYDHAPCYIGSAPVEHPGDGIHDAIANWWFQNGNNDAFPLNDPVMVHLRKLNPTSMGRYSYQYRQSLFEAWESLTMEESLALPYRNIGQTLRDRLGVSVISTPKE